ncbi:hypothetical protein JHK86_038371 [Glycine max]|nr:hypothetical protein JHK86_038371 [Glycine max]
MTLTLTRREGHKPLKGESPYNKCQLNSVKYTQYIYIYIYIYNIPLHQRRESRNNDNDDSIITDKLTSGLEFSKAARQVILVDLVGFLGRNGVSGGLGEADGDLEAVVVGDLLHEAVDLSFGSGEGGGSRHGALHELGLDLHVHELLLERVHGLRHLLEVPRGQRRLQRFDDVAHRLADRRHLRLRVEAGHDGVQARGKPEVVHLLRALTDRVLRVDPRSVHVAFLDRLLHLQLLRFLLLLALTRLPLQRFRRELQFHDLVHQLLRVPHLCLGFFVETFLTFPYFYSLIGLGCFHEPSNYFLSPRFVLTWPRLRDS